MAEFALGGPSRVLREFDGWPTLQSDEIHRKAENNGKIHLSGDCLAVNRQPIYRREGEETRKLVQSSKR